MHGSLMHGFKQYVIERHGQDVWTAVVTRSGVGPWYSSVETYPDEVFSALLSATAAHLQKSEREIQEDYGTFLVPVLVRLYGAFVEPAWRTLDLLEKTESVIHRTIRMKDRAAHPPRLRARRMSQDEVQIEYDSPRRLCAVALGICRGVALHYSERVDIEQPECMHAGDRVCRLVVRLLNRVVTVRS